MPVLLSIFAARRQSARLEMESASHRPKRSITKSQVVAEGRENRISTGVARWSGRCQASERLPPRTVGPDAYLSNKEQKVRYLRCRMLPEKKNSIGVSRMPRPRRPSRPPWETPESGHEFDTLDSDRPIVFSFVHHRIWRSADCQWLPDAETPTLGVRASPKVPYLRQYYVPIPKQHY